MFSLEAGPCIIVHTVANHSAGDIMGDGMRS